MSGTWLMFRAELFRLRRSRAIWLAAVFVFLASSSRVLAARLSDSAARFAAARQGRELLGLEEGRGWALLVEGWRTGLALGALLLLIHGARSVAGDRERGVLRLASTRTVSRSGLLLGRALLGPVLVLGLTLVSGAGAYLAANHWFELGPLVEDGYLILGRDEVLYELRVAVLLALPALWAVHVFAMLVSSLSRGVTVAVASSVTLFLAFDLFKDALGRGQYWVFATFSPSFVDSSAMQEMVGVANGYSDAGYVESLVRMNLMLPWGWGLLALVLAVLFVNRRRI